MNQHQARATEEARFFYRETARGPAIYINPGPNRLRFPVLFLEHDISNPEDVARKIAAILSEHWEDQR